MDKILQRVYDLKNVLPLKKSIMIVISDAIFDKLSIRQIEQFFTDNGISLPHEVHSKDRRTQLRNHYKNLINVDNPSPKNEKIVDYKNEYIDNYVHEHFQEIMKNLRTYKLIITSAIEVTNHMSLHCNETAFQKALEYELSRHGVVTRERYIPIYYKTALVYQARIDFEFQGFIIELKLIDKLCSKNETQLKMYLDNTHYTKGLLINFNTKCNGNRKCIDTRVLIKV